MIYSQTCLLSPHWFPLQRVTGGRCDSNEGCGNQSETDQTDQTDLPRLHSSPFFLSGSACPFPNHSPRFFVMPPNRNREPLRRATSAVLDLDVLDSDQPCVAFSALPAGGSNWTHAFSRPSLKRSDSD